MKELAQIIAENVKYYRSQSGLSQLKLATKLDMAPSYLAEIETAKQLPSLHIVERLAKEFCVLPYQLLYPQGLATEHLSNPDYIRALVAIKDQINNILDNQINKNNQRV